MAILANKLRGSDPALAFCHSKPMEVAGYKSALFLFCNIADPCTKVGPRHEANAGNIGTHSHFDCCYSDLHQIVGRSDDTRPKRATASAEETPASILSFRMDVTRRPGPSVLSSNFTRCNERNVGTTLLSDLDNYFCQTPYALPIS